MAGPKETNPIPSIEGYLHCYKSGDPDIVHGNTGVLAIAARTARGRRMLRSVMLRVCGWNLEHGPQ
jgi:hypothetical protein